MNRKPPRPSKTAERVVRALRSPSELDLSSARRLLAIYSQAREAGERVQRHLSNPRVREMLLSGGVSPEAEAFAARKQGKRPDSYGPNAHLYAELGWRLKPGVSREAHEQAYERNLGLIGLEIQDYDSKMRALNEFIRVREKAMGISASRRWWKSR